MWFIGENVLLILLRPNGYNSDILNIESLNQKKKKKSLFHTVNRAVLTFISNQQWHVEAGITPAHFIVIYSLI